MKSSKPHFANASLRTRLRRSAILKSVFIFLIFFAGARSGWAQQNVVVSPSDNLPALVNQYPAGTTFTLTAGIYRTANIVPKDYDTFVAQESRQAVFSGAVPLTNFTQNGAYWTAQVAATQLASYPGSSNCGPNPICYYPEDLFFDNQLKSRVATLAAVGPGNWYLDYSTGTAYLGDDPSGHTVEMSSSRTAFTGIATNVTLSNLVVEKYACLAQSGAVDASIGNYWTVEGSEVRLNHGTGIRTGIGTYVHDNYVHNNGQLGIGGSGSDVTLQNNEIASNNYANYTIYWEAGGTKFSGASNITFRYNYTHDNIGPGFWVDLWAQQVLCDSNQFTNNREAAVMVEISNDVTVSNNYIWNDAYNTDGTGIWWGDAVLIEDSTWVSVFSNNISNCMNGIGAILQSRGWAPNGQLYTVANVNVNSNNITQGSGIALGIALEPPEAGTDVYTSWNNQFQYNNLTLTNSGASAIYWMNQPMTLTQWIAALAGL
jgi:hypothetical protein